MKIDDAVKALREVIDAAQDIQFRNDCHPYKNLPEKCNRRIRAVVRKALASMITGSVTQADVERVCAPDSGEAQP